MKRWRDRDFEDDSDRRDEIPPGPLEVQSLAPHGPLRRFGLPVGIALIVLIVVLVRTTQLVTYFGGSQPTPAPPTPITWVDTTAEPTPPPTPTPTPGAKPTPTPLLLPEVDVAYELFQLGWRSPGDTIHFTITLTNNSGSAIPFAPCPLYRMYLVGSAEPKADRLLNCPAAGSGLRPGQSLSFDMAFVMPADASAGDGLISWEARSGFRGSTTIPVSVGPPLLPSGETPSAS
jgi:hypothetical protein